MRSFVLFRFVPRSAITSRRVSPISRVAIEKAKESCKNSGLEVEDHISHVGNMVDLGSGAQREIENITCA